MPSKTTKSNTESPVEAKKTKSKTKAQNNTKSSGKTVPKRKAATKQEPGQHKKIFITYLNDPDRDRSADLISLVDSTAAKLDMNRSKYVTQLIIADLVKRGVIRRKH